MSKRKVRATYRQNQALMLMIVAGIIMICWAMFSVGKYIRVKSCLVATAEEFVDMRCPAVMR